MNRQAGEASSVRLYYVALASAFTAVAIYGSFVPLQVRELSFSEALQQFSKLPFFSVGVESRTDWATNVLLFVPLGFCWIGALSCNRSRAIATGWAVLLVPLLGVLSTCIEFGQLWFPARTPSQNDMAAESLGALFGAIGWIAFGNRFTAWCGRYFAARAPANQVVWLLQAYLAGFLIYSFLPLDLTISVAEMYRKARSGGIRIVPFTQHDELTIRFLLEHSRDVLLAIPIGALCALYSRKKVGAPPQFVSSCLAGIAVIAAVELGQVFVVSRVAATSEIILGAAGIVLGATLAYRWIGYKGRSDLQSVSPSSRMVQIVASSLIAIVYAMGLCAWFWMPFNFLSDGEQIRERLHATLSCVPGASLYAGTEINAVVQVLKRLLAYAPLGAIAVLWSRSISSEQNRTRIALGFGFAACALLTTLIELGQVLLPTRTPDFSEVPICLAGFGLGALISWRLLISAHGTQANPLTKVKITPLENVAPRNTRFPGLDGLRAIACLAVFGVHLQQMTGIKGTWGPFDWKLLLENGNTGVALFFMLSGALLSSPLWLIDFTGVDKQWTSRYTFKRMLRILPPYYACLVGLMIWRRGKGEFLNSLLHIAMLHNYRETSFYSLAPSFWTIAVQAQFYILLPLIFWLLSRRPCFTVGRHWVVLSMAVAAYALHYSIMERLAVGQRTVVYSHSVLAHLPHLLLGVFVGRYLARVKPAKEQNKMTCWLCDGLVGGVSIVILAILGTSWESWFELPHGRYHLPYIPILLGIAIAAVPRSAIALWLFELKLIRFIGVISFGIYVYHYSLMQLMAKVMQVLGISPEENWPGFAIASFLLSLGVASASYYWLENPLIAWCSKDNRAANRAQPPGSAKWSTVC